MVKQKRVWRLFYLMRPFMRKPEWRRSFHDFDYAQTSPRAFSLSAKSKRYAAIPGTVQPDGSIAWPKEWPVP